MGRRIGVDTGAPHMLRAKADAMTPFVFQEDGMALPDQEQDPSLKVDGPPVPPGSNVNLAIVGGEDHAHGRNLRP